MLNRAMDVLEFFRFAEHKNKRMLSVQLYRIMLLDWVINMLLRRGVLAAKI